MLVIFQKKRDLIFIRPIFLYISKIPQQLETYQQIYIFCFYLCLFEGTAIQWAFTHGFVSLVIIYRFLMSLIIVGSCSKITQNIVLAAAKQSLYKKITISDLLPVYQFHQRYYRLRRHLKDQKCSTQVCLDKIVKTDELYHQIQSHDHVLYVTHDYFHSTTSKTKLMELTAQYSKNKERVVFATPIEYDHYGYQNPEQNYLDNQHKIRQTNPNAAVLRSDIQDTTELYAYLHRSKPIWEDKLLQTPASFKPKVVGAQFYAQRVVEALRGEHRGEDIVIRGSKQRHFSEVQHNKEIESYETKHLIDNLRLLVTKYRGPEDRYSKLITYKF